MKIISVHKPSCCVARPSRTYIIPFFHCSLQQDVTEIEIIFVVDQDDVMSGQIVLHCRSEYMNTLWRRSL